MHRSETVQVVLPRRRWLAAACVSVGALCPPWHARAATDAQAPFNDATDLAAFAADRVDRAVALLTGTTPPRTASDVAIDAPDLFEDGAAVPFTLRATAPQGVHRLALLIDKNPTPLVAVFTFGQLVDPEFGIRVKMAETSDVRLLGWLATAGAVTQTRRRVAVVEGGCGDEPIDDSLTAARLPGPMRIRAELRRAGSGGAVVRVLMRHPMETGLRKDGAGRVVPAWHITRVRATLNGAPAFVADWGNAVSANPYLQFTLPGAVAGDRVTIDWADNSGGTRQDDATVA